MTIRSGQSITVDFTTRRFDTGVATNADTTPTGTLVVNGTDNATSVTVTSVATGYYKAAMTLPTLSFGDMVQLRVGATVNSISDNAIVWSDTKDVAIDSSGITAADLQTIKTRAVGDPGGTVTIPQSIGTSTFAGGAVTSVTGDVGGKVLGGGSGTITGVGANANDASGNAVATSSGQTGILNAVNAITRNTARSMPVTGLWFVRPQTGTTTFGVDLYLYNLAGQLQDPDTNTVTITAGSSAGGTQYNTYLSATTMTRVAAGHYRVSYTVAGLDQGTPHPQGEAYFAFAWTITELVNGSSTAVAGADAAVVQVQDAEQLATLNAIQLQANKIGTNAADSPNAVAAQTAVAGAAADAAAARATTDQFRFTTPHVVDAAVVGSDDVGPWLLTVTVKCNGVAVQNAAVRLFSSGVTAAAPATTNSSGVVTLGLDDGTYTMVVVKSGFQHTPQTVVVTASAAVDATMNSQVVEAIDVSQTTAYLTTYDGQGNPAPDQSFTFTLIAVPDQLGVSFDRTPFAAVSDSNGLLQVPLLRNSTYTARRGNGRSVTFTTSAGTTFELPDILGR